jgi:hypothetical protein
MVLLGADAGALTGRGKWMQTARLWRLLLLQQEDGCWDLGESLAFALEAHEGVRPPKGGKKGKGLSALVTLCFGDGDLDEQLDDAADEVMTSDDDEEEDGQAKQHDTQRIRDCPISFSSMAVAQSMPHALLALNGEHGRRQLTRRLTFRAAGPVQSSGASSVPVERIWATVLAISVLESLDVCWLVDDEEEPERTIVDAARDWLDAQGAADERVQQLLDSGELQAAAAKARKMWKQIMEYQIAQLRDAEVVNRFTALTHVQRASGRVIKSIMTDHGEPNTRLRQARARTHATLAVQAPLQPSWMRTATSCAGSGAHPSHSAACVPARRLLTRRRRRRFMILVTLVLSTLLVSIWYVRASMPPAAATS